MKKAKLHGSGRKYRRLPASARAVLRQPFGRKIPFANRIKKLKTINLKNSFGWHYSIDDLGPKMDSNFPDAISRSGLFLPFNLPRTSHFVVAGIRRDPLRSAAMVCVLFIICRHCHRHHQHHRMLFLHCTLISMLDRRTLGCIAAGILEYISLR